MGLTMLEMIDNRLAHFFPQPELYDVSPFSIENLRDCIIMFILKDAYYLTEPKQSLRENRGTDADDVRMRDSRSIAYAQHYRDLQYNHVKNDLGIEIPELLSADVETMRGKLQGHNITPMQYFELNTLTDHPLLKAIINKRICDVKKISNSTLIAASSTSSSSEGNCLFPSRSRSYESSRLGRYVTVPLVESIRHRSALMSYCRYSI